MKLKVSHVLGGGDAHFNVNVVTGNDRLAANGADLNLDVDDAEGLGADVDLDKTGVDGPVELAEARHETDGT